VNTREPVNAYKEIQIKTANQIRLIVMLYDGAIRHLNLALDAVAEGHRRYDEVNNHIIAAQDILSELTASLDFEKGGVLAKNLFSLYSFMNRRLLEANLNKDAAPIAEVKKHLGELRESWDEISTRKGIEEKVTPSSGVNIAG
jgi:flagellar secretion chaperone FliS